MKDCAIHEIADLDQALLALSRADPAIDAGCVLLVSPPGAGAWLGPAWWWALCHLARTRSGCDFCDLLDCGDASGRALEALRLGLRGLILGAEAPGRATIAARCAASGATLLAERPARCAGGRAWTSLR